MSGPPPGAPAGAGAVPKGHVFFEGDDRLEGILEWPERDTAGGVAVAVGAAEGAAAAAGIVSGAAVAEGPAAVGPAAVGPAGRVAGGVVVAHPHPLHGGTMAQPVVYRTAKACREIGLATLRLNFRGVGNSRGTFSGTEEHRDVEAAAAFLAGKLAGSDGDSAPGARESPLALAGYSFGSVMAARAAAGAVPVRALVLIGFVVAWRELPADTLTRLAAFRGPVLAVCAENDDIGYPEEVERMLTKLGMDFRLEVIENAGHFLEGRHREVGERVATFLGEVLVLGRGGGRAGPLGRE